MIPKVVLCTLVLNEMEWLPYLYEQHKDWPGLVKWVFVEAADAVYRDTNPEMVNTDTGLSVDGTTEFLSELQKADDRIVHIKHGLCGVLGESDPAQFKCQARNQYLEVAEELRPDFLFILDADEFYTQLDQTRVMESMRIASTKPYRSFCFKHRHPWKPPSLILEPLLAREVVGGFWDIPHVRGWRWYPGLRYVTNHNTPQLPNGMLMDRPLCRFDLAQGSPQCVHMAFSSSVEIRHAKHQYYEARGEGRTDKRGWYTVSRAAFETWQEGDVLPRGAIVQEYTGPVPECFALLSLKPDERIGNGC